MRTLAALVLLLALAGAAAAEPLDLTQNDVNGSGFGFRRGDTCTALTALHVVQADGVAVRVADRTGGRADAQRTYANPAYDLALVTLPTDATVACTTRWPDTTWLKTAAFGTRSQFEVVRHYANGRETIVLMRFVGRTETTLTLAPVDKVGIRESDSGSLVFFEGKPVGIVQRLDPASDRVEVLRFDVIDQLVGTRFRAAVGRRRVALEGVFRSGRPVANWTVYARAWLEESAQAAVVDAKDGQASCRVRADVITWQPANEPNPEYTSLQQRLRTCGSVPIFGQTMCNQIREQLRTTPAQLTGFRVTLDLALTTSAGSRQNKLTTTTHLSPTRDREAAERTAVQEAFGSALTPMLKDGACD